MRRFLTACLIVIVLIASFADQRQTTAQSQVYIPSPPPIKVEISGKEPPPAGIAGQLTYNGGGGDGGSYDDFTDPPQGLFWYKKIDYGAELFSSRNDASTACGYRSKTPPKATVRTPSGRQLAAKARLYAGFHHRNGTDQPGNYCFDIESAVLYELGMEFGVYTLTLDHPDGTLSYSWGIDYPICPTVLPIGTGNDQYWLMNIPAGEVSIYFYDTKSDEDHALLIASRKLSMGMGGDALVTLTASRSSGLSATTPFKFVRVIFVGSNQTIYGHSGLGVLDLEEQLFTAKRTPAPACLEFIEGNKGSSGGALIRKPDTPLLNTPGGTPGTTLPAGEPVQIVAVNSTIMNGNRPQVWVNVRTEDNRSSWLLGSALSPHVGTGYYVSTPVSSSWCSRVDRPIRTARPKK